MTRRYDTGGRQYNLYIDRTTAADFELFEQVARRQGVTASSMLCDGIREWARKYRLRRQPPSGS
jgi:hypothetical protein